MLDGVFGFWVCIVTDGGGHEAVAVEGHVVVTVLGHLGLLVSQTAQGAGGAGVLFAAALGLHCQKNEKYSRDITGFIFKFSVLKIFVYTQWFLDKRTK